MNSSRDNANHQAIPLAELLDAVTTLALAGDGGNGTVVRHLTGDSREVQSNSLFIAVRGYCTDGHRFIGNAVERGAVAVICEEFPAVIESFCLYIKVADARKALAETARLFYGNASDRLKIIGVTGTNGKTTTAKLITAMLNANGISTGYIGTNLCQIGEQHIPLERTTPEAHELHALFLRMVEAGCCAVVMEVSSHALVLQRVYGLRFHAAVFTNLTMEHLDFHRSMAAYAAAKQQLFDQLAPDGFAVFNHDDPFAQQMALRVAPEKRYCCTLRSGAVSTVLCRHFFEAEILQSSIASSTVKLHFPETVMTMQVGLPGAFNVMNLLEAAAVGTGMALSAEAICHALSAISAVDGRMERVGDGSENVSVFVDYAHTPDALCKALETLRALKPAGSRLMVLFGCGGNRDQSKRSEMGRIASELADLVILTSDNPRDEHPEMILDDIERGIQRGIERGHHLRISDRAEAIAQAVAMLKEGDVLLVAGKGHERYQEIAGRKFPFSDQEQLRKVMQKNGAEDSAKERRCE
jgi:UDP-N-acetylmuramyl-tripeptide synthetase